MHALNSNKPPRLNLAYTSLFARPVPRVGLDCAVERQEEEDAAGASRSEIDASDSESREAESPTVPGLQSARWEARFSSSGVVHCAVATCNGTSNKAANSPLSPAPMPSFDESTDRGTIPFDGAVRECGNSGLGVAGTRDKVAIEANTRDGFIQRVPLRGGQSWAAEQALQSRRVGCGDTGDKMEEGVGSSEASPLPGCGAERADHDSHLVGHRQGDSTGAGVSGWMWP